MDNWTRRHFEEWLDQYCWPPSTSGDEKENIRALVLNFCEREPEVLLKWSWPEILAFARESPP